MFIGCSLGVLRHDRWIHMQRTRDEAKEQDSFSKVGKDIVPGGFGTLVLLGGSTVGYLAMNFSG